MLVSIFKFSLGKFICMLWRWTLSLMFIFFNMERAKLVFFCSSGGFWVCFYVEEGKPVDFFRRMADFLVDLASSDDSKASPDMARAAWQ